MPAKMAPHQLDFWRELLAPFRDEELSFTSRGGKELTYIDKRALENRLDSVCGPHGWYPEYEATNRGYKCRLYISVPMETPGTFVFMHKEDGAGFEEMGSYNKQTKEWEPDVDNDEKSGYTNALRRAAQDAWGIGRYLYRKGIPSFLDPNASPPSSSAFQQPEATAAAQAALSSQRTREQQAPAPAPAAKSQPEQSGPANSNFRIPKPGKQVFAWAKEMEKIFETEIVKGMGARGEERGWGSLMSGWDEEQVKTICMTAIEFIRELPYYKGQFEYLFPQGGVQSAQPTEPPKVPGVNIADLRRGLMAKMQELYEKQTGQKPDNVALKRVFEAVASSAKTAEGHTGEVPEGLSKMTDIVWLKNMIALVDQQIAETATVAAAADEDDEIPF